MTPSLEAAGWALVAGGALALSPADELACALTGPLAVVCVPLTAIASPVIGLALIAGGATMMYLGSKPRGRK